MIEHRCIDLIQDKFVDLRIKDEVYFPYKIMM